jgi:hypothetical protein
MIEYRKIKIGNLPFEEVMIKEKRRMCEVTASNNSHLIFLSFNNNSQNNTNTSYFIASRIFI